MPALSASQLSYSTARSSAQSSHPLLSTLACDCPCLQDLLGEKGRVLKAVQGQYGMEVQDLTSATHTTHAHAEAKPGDLSCLVCRASL